ncbi:MAG: hypothetical protein MUE50_00080 [Pirellulaceae bacterium]|nr:hypothetical protein [Pirellulaceae bacterium]
MDAAVKRRLRGLAKAADDIEGAKLRGVVWVETDVAEWLESHDTPAEPLISAPAAADAVFGGEGPQPPAESPIFAAADPQTEESPGG